MAVFRFKLENLLRHRRIAEDQRQRQLARHQRYRMILLEQLRQMQQTIRDSKHALAGGLVGQVNLDAVWGFARYSGQVNQRAQQIVVRLAELEKHIDQAREALQHAVRQRRSLELLRDKHYEQWRREQDRHESQELDQIMTEHFVRCTAEGGGLPFDSSVGEAVP